MNLISRAYPRYTFYLLLSFFFLSNSLFAQGILFSPSNARTDQLNSRQEAAYDRTVLSQAYSNLQLIDIAPLDEIMGNRSLRLNFGQGEINLQLHTVEYVNESNYYLYGEHEGSGSRNDLGPITFQLRSMDGMKFGYIQTSNAFYQIDDLGDGQNILMKQVASEDESETAIDGDDTEVGSLAEAAPPSPIAGSRSNCDVRVLFLYTSSAAGKVTNANTTAQQHIDQTNQALANSNVSSSSLRFVLAGVETITTLDETNLNSSQLLNNLRGNGTAQARRNANDADLVCLIADDQIANFGNVAGRAFIGTNGAPAANNSAYCMIRLSSSLDLKLFAHEGGHNMGCSHELASNNEPGFHHAHEWTWVTGWLWWRRTNRRQTVVFSTLTFNETALHYSNPNVNFTSGNPTGTATSDNARTLRDNACTVAAYRNASANLVVGINGPDIACPFESPCWSANVSGAPGPYTYQWAWSTNGSTYTNFGTGFTACLNMFNFNAPQLITLRLRVTAPGQPAKFAYKNVDLVVASNGQILCAFKTNDPTPPVELVGAENALQVVPNPADLRSEVVLYLTQNGPTEIDLFDITGQKVMDIANENLDAGNHRFALDANRIPAGIYLIQAVTNGQRLVQRFIVTH